MRYAILGTTQALRDDGTPVTLAGGRLRALLTALALRPGRVIGADALIDEVWDGDPPAGGTGALQALVGRLRRAVGHDAIGSVDGGYRLEAARDDVDLYRFERLAEEGARALADGDPVKASGLLGDALALWRGTALADLPDRGTAAVRSEALRLDARRQRLAAELALGRAGQILPELAELAAAHPLDEPVQALHLRALQAVGRTADALAGYESVRRTLADQLGADPSVELRMLHAELLSPASLPPAGPAAAATGADAVPPAPSRPRRPAGNARARLTSFVGRESDLDAVRGDLGRARLVTLTGPGGTGKTRLSQEAGDLLAGRWADGVWYAELAPVSDPSTLPEAVVSSLGLRETLLHSGSAAETALAVETRPKDATRQLADHLAHRSLLLVLDNCEHLIDAAAALAEQLLADCPGLTVLATSREPLGVPGELVRPLDPLPDPTALRLLADRGAAARPGFTVEEDPAACAELCRRLDGLPLAIELAAARLRSLSPRQLADRLDDRFRLLTGGSRTLLPRQQTLRAVVDWSWDLMEPAERMLLRRLAVFRGGWTLEAVEAVCPDPAPATSGPAATSAPAFAPAPSSAPGSGAFAAAAADSRATPPATPGGRVPASDAIPASPASSAASPAQQPAPAAAGGPAGTTAAGPYGPYAPGRTPAGPQQPEGAHGPRTPAGAERLEAPDAAALLASLVDKSLVLADLTEDGVRYRMLETIGEYAAERLDASGERPAVEARHIAYFREYVRTADPLLRGAGQLVWFERLEREHENLRAALRRAVAAGDEQEALQLVLGCSWFWEVRNHPSERQSWPKAVAAMGPDPFAEPPALVPLERGPLDDPPPMEGERLLEARRWVRVVDIAARDGESQWFGDPELVRVGTALIATYPPHLPQSARPPGLLRAYGAFFTGQYDRLRELIDETVEACRIHDRRWELAFALQLRAKVNNDISEYLGDSVRDIGESRRLFQQLGDEWGAAETLAAEAEAAINSGDWERGAVCCEEGIALARKIGSHQYVPVLTVRRGDALVNAGRVEEGMRLLREGIDDAGRFGAASDGAAFFGRVLLAVVLGRQDRVEEALQLVDETLADTATGQGPEGVPGFVTGMLDGLRGYLIGRSGAPERGLALLTAGIEKLNSHPLAEVITPRLPIVLSPGVVELLTVLAEADAADGAGAGASGRAQRRAGRAAVIMGTHDRLRPVAIPPAEAEQMAGLQVRLRALLGDEAFDAGYAAGDGLSVTETVALMRDVD